MNICFAGLHTTGYAMQTQANQQK